MSKFIRKRDEIAEARVASHTRVISNRKVKSPQGYHMPQPPSGRGPGRRNRFNGCQDARHALARANGGLRALAAQDYIQKHKC